MTEAEIVLLEVIRELAENAEVIPAVTVRCLARYPVLTEESVARCSIGHLLEKASQRLQGESAILVQASALLGH